MKKPRFCLSLLRHHAWILALFVCCLPAMRAGERDRMLSLGKDFAAQDQLVAVKDGDWLSPDTWSAGRLPLAKDFVTIPWDRTVAIAGTATARQIQVSGTLELLDGAALTVTTLWGEVGSTIRTRALPGATGITGTITLRDEPINLLTDPEQYSGGLLAFGTVSLQGRPKDGFALVQSVAKGTGGATVLTLAQAPLNWAAGDMLCFPEAGQLQLTKDLRKNGVDHEQTELAVIVAIAGTSVTVRPSVAGATLGFPQAAAHVANLTRSFLISSPPGAVTRGHVMMLETAGVTIRYVEFANLGRTSAQSVLDSAPERADGSHGPAGKNQIGRYSLHLHHLRRTSLVEGTSIHDGRKWALAVHDTHYGTMRGNVLARCEGAGLMTEDGSERGNNISGNFALGIRAGYRDTAGFGGVNKISKTLVDTGLDGSGFWFRTAGNRVEDNVAAACFAGFNYNGYYLDDGIYFPTGQAADGSPVFPPKPVLRTDPPLPALIPFGTSANNTAYGVGIGLWVTWHLGTDLAGYQQNPTAFEGFTIRNVYGNGVEVYHTANVTLRNFTLAADAGKSSTNEGDDADLGMLGAVNSGVFSGHDAYENGGLVLDGLKVSGFNVGAHLPMNTETNTSDPGTVKVLGGLYKNYVNLMIESPMTERIIFIKDVAFVPVSGVSRVGPRDKKGVVTKSALPAVEADLVLRDTLALEKHAAEGAFLPAAVSFNGAAVYFRTQLADYVIPNVSGIDKTTVGLRNRDLKAAGRSPISGELVEATAVEEPARMVGVLRAK